MRPRTEVEKPRLSKYGPQGPVKRSKRPQDDAGTRERLTAMAKLRAEKIARGERIEPEDY